MAGKNDLVGKEELGAVLKEMVDKEGPEFLTRDPYGVYKSLLGRKISPRLSRILLLLLLSGVTQKAREEDEESLSRFIQRECFLKKSMADAMAGVFAALFSLQNQKDWEQKSYSGFQAFCQSPWEFHWEGEDTWYTDGVHVDVSFDGDAILKVEDSSLAEAAASALLSRNPFTSADELKVYFEKELSENLDQEFHEYAMADDYYPPVGEDFEFSVYLEEMARKMGFRVVSWEGSGSTSDYEPNDRYDRYDRW